MTFDKNLKKYRKEKRISQDDLAKAIGLMQSSIANYENGNRKPTIDLLIKIAQYLNVSVDDLLGVEKIDNQKIDDNLEEIKKVLLNYLLVKNEYEVFKNIEKLYNSKRNIAFIFDRIITPVMYEIGILWEHGDISIADEHCITEIMSRMIDWLAIQIMGNNAKANKAVCQSFSIEQHTLGIKMVSAVLEKEGYNTIFIGNNLPTRELIEILINEKPMLLFLSVTLSTHIDALINLIERIKSIPQLSDTRIIIGGQGVKNNIEIGKVNDIDIIENTVELEKWLSSMNNKH